MFTRSIVCLLLTLFLFTVAEGQPEKIRRIGFLSPSSKAATASNLDAFRQALKEAGYIDGKNIIIEYRWAGGKLDQLPKLAEELVSMGVDIIVTGGTPPVLAAKQATRTIPIVAANADNLVELGVIASLARPGGNVTGLTRVDADFSAKRLELLKESFPKLSRVAILSHGALGADQEELQETRAVARAVGVEIRSFNVQEPSQFLDTYAEILKRRAEALVFFTSAFTIFHRRQLVELAIKNRLGTMCGGASWSNDGCLMSYGPNVTQLYRRAAVFVDKLLKGAKPADLPVVQPTKFEFIVNLKTAQQIGITLPPNVLARADRVIK